MAATPVGAVARAVAVARESLVDTILKTELLKKPLFAVTARVIRAEIDRDLAAPPQATA